MAKPVVSVSGKNGQLGSELQQLALQTAAFDFHFTDKTELDLTSQDALSLYFEQHKPAFFVNCAAYTAVDKAETDKETSYLVNATSVGYISALCHQYNTVLVQISTDYVFNGVGHVPYFEDDPTDPVNHYGYTKREGERLAFEHNLHTIIIRTSWVYSAYGHNFVKTMLRLMKDRTELNVVNDQHGSPTYAADLAEAILSILIYCTQQPVPSGVYHFSNEGNISWYEFAVAIAELSGSSCQVHAIPSDQFPTPAKRPTYSVLSKQKIGSVFSIQTKPWRESLRTCMEKMGVLSV